MATPGNSRHLLSRCAERSGGEPRTRCDGILFAIQLSCTLRAIRAQISHRFSPLRGRFNGTLLPISLRVPASIIPRRAEPKIASVLSVMHANGSERFVRRISPATGASSEYRSAGRPVGDAAQTSVVLETRWPANIKRTLFIMSNDSESIIGRVLTVYLSRLVLKLRITSSLSMRPTN